jgi:PAS domain S-box-containing protein
MVGNLVGEERQRTEAEIINEVTRDLSSELDLHTLLQKVTDAATKLTGAQFGAFFYNTINEQGEAFLLYTLSGAPREAFEKFGTPRNTAIFDPTFRGEGVVRLDDVRKDPRYGHNAPHYGMPKGHLPVCSYLAVPVVLRSGEVAGGLFFGHSEPAVFTEHSERMAVNIAAQAVVAIDNARLYGQITKELRDRIAAEQSLRESEARLRLATDTGKVGLWDWDVATNRVSWTDSLYLIHGVKHEEFDSTAEGFAKLIHPEDRDLVSQAIQRAMESDVPYEIEFRVVRPDGDVIWLYTNARVIREGGRPVRMLGATMDITPRKHMEIALRETEERFAKAFEASPLALTLSSLRTGKFLEVNETFVTLTGYAREEAVGRTATELGLWVNPREQAEGREVIRQSGHIRNAEHRFRTRGGAEVIGLVSGERLEISGEPCILTVIQDITERKRAEEALRQSRERLDWVVKSTELGLWYCDLPFDKLNWNQRTKQHFGLPADADVTIETFYERLHPDDRERTAQAIEHSINENTSYDITYRTVGLDGQTRWIRAIGTAVRDVEGIPRRFDGVTVDMTPQKHAELLLQENERRYRNLIQAMPAAIYTCDAAGRITLYNDAAVALWGREPELGKDLWCGSFRIYQPDGSPLPLDECPMAVTLKEGRAVRGQEILVERPDGDRRNVMPYPEPIRDANGALIGAINMLVDITEQRQAGHAQAQLAAIVESSDDAIVSKDLNGIIKSWNKGAERIFGYTAQEAVGRPITLIIPPENHSEETLILGRIRRGERIDHFETIRQAKDGRQIDISLTVSPIKDSTGRVIGASKIARDISERKHAEKERARLLAREQEARLKAEEANRLKDEFLATVSHELRTPLNGILGWISLLRSGKLNQAMSATALETIERNARSQNRLIEDLLDVSRIISGKMRLDVRQVSPIAIIEAAVETIRPTAEAKGVRLQTVLDPLAGPVSGDANRLQQIIWNLLSNAVKFTPRNGRVMVQLQRVNSHLEIVVGDTGIGIDAKFLPHVFERFRQADGSSTRPHGGLGLGLAIVRHLVELHGGSVHVDSAGENLGATFTVKLPVAVALREQPGRVHPAASDTLPSDNGIRLDGIRVLAVDDEPDARMLLSALLGAAGAEVSVAESSDEALGLLASKQFDVIIGDIEMPREDGYTFIRKVRQLEADGQMQTPAIALTAYARAEDRVRALTSGYQTHVPKPVEPTELMAVITSLTRRTNKVPES